MTAPSYAPDMPASRTRFRPLTDAETAELEQAQHEVDRRQAVASAALRARNDLIRTVYAAGGAPSAIGRVFATEDRPSGLHRVRVQNIARVPGQEPVTFRPLTDDETAQLAAAQRAVDAGQAAVEQATSARNDLIRAVYGRDTRPVDIGRALATGARPKGLDRTVINRIVGKDGTGTHP